jgi:predicted nucleic acid-binding protein
VRNGHVELVADASCLINFFASGRAREIIMLWDVTLILTDMVDGEIKRNRAVLEELYALGLARKESLPPEANVLFLTAAVEVDDGEASAIALAIVRGWPIATDDVRAQNVWLEMAGPGAQPARGTCGLLQQIAAELGALSLREVLLTIGSEARFDPPKVHAEWWARVLNSGESK